MLINNFAFSWSLSPPTVITFSDKIISLCTILLLLVVIITFPSPQTLGSCGKNLFISLNDFTLSYIINQPG